VRIVAVADTHLFEEQLGPVPDGDVFVHAGDMLRSGRLEELDYAARFIRALPHPTKVVIAGNHDWCFARPGDRDEARRRLGDDVVYLEDSGAVIGGLRFWGSPWQPWFQDWAFNLPRGEALADKWALIPDDTDVLVTHGPPAGYGDRVGRAGPQGCADLLTRLREVEPALHLYGHIHEDGGLWREGPTVLANVTTWECERAATVLDIDPATREVSEVYVPARRG
jgi:predicted phosphohydrolase